MKQFFTAAALLCSMASMGQIRMPAPSPTQKITQAFGLGTIELVYSRPNIKGRTLMKDNSDLAPLNKLWRTGANAATRITFSDRVMLGGKLLDTGSYVLYTIPGKEYWEIILNKGLNNWGTDGYKESEDVVHTKVKAEKINRDVETFTMQFSNVQPESCNLDIRWGTTLVSVPMSVNIKDRIRSQVEAELGKEKVDVNNYYSAASFYYEWDKNLNKALVNINKATQGNPKAYWMWLLQAKIQKDMGDKVSAKASAEKCAAAATEGKNDEYVKLANELMAKL
jgi:hypothetical protein